MKICHFNTNILASSLLSIIIGLTAIKIEANDEYKTVDDFFSDIPVVLTASRLQKPINLSPSSITVIDRQKIVNFGITTLEDIFRMVPGFFVTHVGYESNSPVVFNHGLGTRYYRLLQVLIDGRSVFIPSYGGIPWRNLPLLVEDIERVEIIRGPNSATYGSNAFLSTINFVTRHAAEDEGGFVSALSDIDNGNDRSRLYARLGGDIGNAHWRLSAGREDDDGIEDWFDSSRKEIIDLRGDFQPSTNQYISFHMGANQTSTKRGDGDADDVFRTEIGLNTYQSLKWEIVNQETTSIIKIYHARDRIDDKFETPPLNDFLGISGVPDFTTTIDYSRYSDRTDFEAYQNKTIASNLKINYGFSVRHDVVRSFYMFHDKRRYSVDTHRVFSSMEWQVSDDFLIDFGLMVEESDYIDAKTTGRLSFIKGLDGHYLRWVSSTANRNPVLWELTGDTFFNVDAPGGNNLLFLNFIGNPDLKPEFILSNEVGLYSFLLEKQLTTDVRLFRYTISDQIAQVDLTVTSSDPSDIFFDDEYDIFNNSAETNVDGIEVSFDYQPHSSDLNILGGMSLIKVDSTESYYNDSYPDSIAYIGFKYSIYPNHQISMLINKVDKLFITDSRSATDSYTRVDFGYKYLIDPENETKIELLGQNVYEGYDDYGLNQKQEKALLLKFSSRM